MEWNLSGDCVDLRVLIVYDIYKMIVVDCINQIQGNAQLNIILYPIHKHRFDIFDEISVNLVTVLFECWSNQQQLMSLYSGPPKII